MPLTLFRRGKIWYIRGTICGTPCYETTDTSDRVRAEAFRLKRENELWDRAVLGPTATVTFDEAALSYTQHRNPEPGDAKRLRRISDCIGSGLLRDIDQGTVDRLYAQLLRPDAAPGTKLRAVLIPLTAVLNHAAKRKWCARPAFERPKQPKGRTEWITPQQAELLIAKAAPHLKALLTFLLCTGARAGEAVDLDWVDVDLSRRTAILRNTKNGRDRIVWLPPAAVVALGALRHKTGAVFRRPLRRQDVRKAALTGQTITDDQNDHGMPYAAKNDGGGHFKRGFRGACERAKLPRTVTPHTLRHTWASWYYCLTHDPMRLRNVGGWSTIALVERYAHLANSDLTAGIARVWGAAHPDQWERAPDVQAANDDAQATGTKR